MHIENDQRLGVAIYKLIYLASWLRKRKNRLFEQNSYLKYTILIIYVYNKNFINEY